MKINLKKLLGLEPIDLKTNLLKSDVEKRIKDNTFQMTSITSVKTSKKFIGYLFYDKFKLIDSSQTGYFCVLHGKLTDDNNCKISIKAKLHNTFLALYIIWVIVLGSLLVWEYRDDLYNSDVYYGLIGFGIMAILFRLFIHIPYTVARQRALKNLKYFLDIK